MLKCIAALTVGIGLYGVLTRPRVDDRVARPRYMTPYEVATSRRYQMN